MGGRGTEKVVLKTVVSSAGAEQKMRFLFKGRDRIRLEITTMP